MYTHLHLRRDKFGMGKIGMIAEQIAQGMGYLHHRGIVHKDLKSKNIFIENGRAIITDFGLVNVARRLCARHNRPELSGTMMNAQNERYDNIEPSIRPHRRFLYILLEANLHIITGTA